MSWTSQSWSGQHRRPVVDLPAGAAVGEYRIEHMLGQGGMGTVYQAIHPVIHKRVALKVIHHELCENPEAVSRFVQEARSVNRIGHPNIVDVFGFGTTEDGRAFLAMELLVGESLAVRLRRVEQMPIEEACDILIEVADALDAAHQAGIIHRDLKPDNVFLTQGRRGQTDVKLLDFGIAKLTSNEDVPREPVHTTQAGTTVGTPLYMAPEQARALPIDSRADIYSLGVMAFEMLAGRPPFTGEDPVEVIAKHITLRPPAPSDFNAEVPELADELLGEMLAKDPGARPSLRHVREVLEQLRRAPRSTRAVDVAARRQRATEILGTPVISEATRRPTRRLWRLVPIVLAVLALGTKLAVSMMDETDDKAPPMAEPMTLHAVTPADETSPPADAPAPVVTELPHGPPQPVPAKSPEHVMEPSPPGNLVAKPGKKSNRPIKRNDKSVETRRVEPRPVVDKPVERPVDSPAVKPVDKPVVHDADGLRSPFEREGT